MAGMGQAAVERLREFLRELKPGARALLVAELERHLLLGDADSGTELILTELRRAIREDGQKAQRIGDPARLFFQPVEPFLVDDGPNHRHSGRIARAVLEPLWLWLSGALLPAEIAAYSEQVEQALSAGDEGKAAELARSMQDRAALRMQQELDALGRDDKARRRLTVQLGTPRAVEDVRTVIGIFKARESLALLGTQMRGHIKALAGPQLEAVKALLDSPLGSKPEVFGYALVLVMSRLAAPWQLIRLGTRAVNGDAGARIADTPYALTVTIVLTEIERMVAELAADLKSGQGVALSALLKDVHDAVRGVRTELDMSGDSAWSRQITAVRVEISNLLTAEIETAPGRVRRLIRPRPEHDIGIGTAIDAGDIVEAEALVGFVAACRAYAGELAISEVTQRTFTELQQMLDTGTGVLLDALRSASEAERPFRQSQVDAAVRFCAKVFGQEYAALLVKAADVALQTQDRRAAAKA